MKRLALILAMLAGPAWSHGDYPLECCGGGPNGDCAVAPIGEVVEAPGGYRVIPTGEFFSYRDPKVRPSHDKSFHRCVVTPRNRASATRCLLVVVGGS